MVAGRRKVTLLSRSVLVRKAVVAHDQRGQAIGEGVDAGAWLGVGALVRPDNVEARVDARDSEPVQGRVAEAQRGQVVGVGQLQRRGG